MAFNSGEVLNAADLNDLNIDTLTTTGNVGIGTTSPASLLEVSSDTGTTPTSPSEVRISTSTNGGSWSTTAPWGQLSFYSADTSNGGAKVQAAVGVSAVDQYGGLGRLGFFLHNATGGSLTEQVSVTNSGKVGIGDNSPVAGLDIATTAGDSWTTSSWDSGLRLNSGSMLRWRTGAGVNWGIGATSGSLYFTTSTGSGSGSAAVYRMTIDGSTGAVTVPGSLSKGSGSFKIPHPLPEMTETHHLVHSFVEAPQADNLYRGRVALVDGAATVDLDEAAGMTTGTFELLNRELQCFVVNNEGWTAVRGSVAGATLTIEAQDATCSDTIDWLVIGERHDQHMYDTGWTDDDGRVIVEPEKQQVTEDVET